MRTVRYHPEARAEFLHEIRYYAAISPGLAVRYDQAVRAAEALAASRPETWPKYTHETRRVVERTFKFSLVYRHTETGGRSDQQEARVLEGQVRQRMRSFEVIRLGDS